MVDATLKTLGLETLEKMESMRISFQLLSGKVVKNWLNDLFFQQTTSNSPSMGNRKNMRLIISGRCNVKDT